MKDFFYYLQFVVFMINILVFIYIMQTNEYNYRGARGLLLIILSIGMLVNIDKITFINVLLSFSTFLSLIKIKPHGKIYRIIEKRRDYFRSNKQHTEKLQRGHKTVAHKEA